jgi:hypothetical protein
MEFDLDDELLMVKKTDLDHDEELLKIQRRKSTPKVVIEEFVQVDSDDDDDNKEKEEEEKQKDDLMCDTDDCQVNNRPHRIKTHIEIEDVSIRTYFPFHERRTQIFIYSFRLYSSRS